MRRAHALLLSATLILAGCLGGPGDDVGIVEPPKELAGLSEPMFEVLKGESIWITSSADATRLHARLFLPDTASRSDWKAPTILVMSPYFGYDARTDPLDPASPPDYFRYQWLIDHFGTRGYAIVFADVRGTGDSGGCLEQTAQLQWQDGYDIVEYLGTQPWSNGRVGMFGKSYDAETQQSTAVMAPPHLSTIVPVSSVSGQYEYSFYDGVPFTLQAFTSNAAYMATDGIQTPTTVNGIAQYHTKPGCHAQMLAQGLDFTGDWNPFWEDREIRHHVQDVKASVLYVHGLQDWNVKPVAIRDWFDQIPSEKRALLGQWAHDYPEANSHERDWSRQDWRTTVHKWYDHFLLGLDNGILDELPPVQVQDSTGVWRREAAFPPTDAAPLTFHLSRDGLVEADPGDLEEPLRMRENGEAFGRDFTGAPFPTVPSEPYGDHILLESEPLAETAHWSGWPDLALDIKLVDGLAPNPDGTLDAHVAANLFAVSASGEAQWLNAAYLSARHQDGVEAPKDIPKDEVVSYQLRFFPSDTVVEAGKSLRLVLSMSDQWTQPEGCFCAAEVSGGELHLPLIERDWEATRLDVPLGKPVTA